MEKSKRAKRILAVTAGLCMIIAGFFAILSSRPVKAEEITDGGITINSEIVTDSGDGNTISLTVTIDLDNIDFIFQKVRMATNDEDKFVLADKNFGMPFYGDGIELSPLGDTATIETSFTVKELSAFSEEILITITFLNNNDTSYEKTYEFPSLKEYWEQYLDYNAGSTCPDEIQLLLNGYNEHFPLIIQNNTENFVNLEMETNTTADLSALDLRYVTFEFPREISDIEIEFAGQDMYGEAITLTLTFDNITSNSVAFSGLGYAFTVETSKELSLGTFTDDIYVYFTQEKTYIQIHDTTTIYQAVPAVDTVNLTVNSNIGGIKTLTIDDTMGAQIDALEDQITTLQNQIETLNDSISALEQSLADKEEENAGLLLQITAYTTQISGLQEQIAGLNGDIAELESAYEIAQDNVVYLTGQVETLNNQITALNGEIAENEAEYEQLLAEYNAAQDSLTAAIEEKNRLAAQVEELNGKIADKEAEYAELLEEYNAIKESLTGDNSELLALINSLRQENSTLKDRIEELENQAAADPGSEEPAGSGCFGNIGGSAAAVCLVLAAALMIRRKKHGKSDKEA